MPNFPSNPTSGQVFLWKGNKYIWNGRQWVNVTEFAVETVAIATVSASPPVDPTTGLMWFKSSTNELLIWVEGLTGGSWEAVVTEDAENNPLVTVSDSPPSESLAVGSLWFKPSQNELFVRVEGLSGYEWELVNQGGSEFAPLVTVSESPPLASSEGSLWFRPSSGVLYILSDLGLGEEWNPVNSSTSNHQPPVSVSASQPSSPSVGDLWFNPSSQTLFVQMGGSGGSIWQSVNALENEVEPAVIVSESPPVNPQQGALWFRNSSEELFLRVLSLSGPDWKLVNSLQPDDEPPVTISSSPPSEPYEGSLWYDTTLGNLSVWYIDLDGGQWVSVGSGGSDSNFLLSDETPEPLGNSSPGTLFEASRADHVHPPPGLGMLGDVRTTGAVDRSILFYDSFSGEWVANSLVTVPEVTNGGNF